MPQDDDPRLGERLRLLLHPLVAEIDRRSVGDDVADVLLEPVQTRLDQQALVRRDDDQVDDREGARDDDQQREREPSADAANRVHVSRKR
jgi:hypothetical protein